jgi:peptide/nickel transport system permease protein
MKQAVDLEERYYLASQWQLMGRKFRRHKLAVAGAIILGVFYFVAIFCEFLAPSVVDRQDQNFIDCPPQRIHFVSSDGRFHPRPFTYGLIPSKDPVTWRRIYKEDTSTIFPLALFVRGEPYKLWNLIPGSIHLFGVREGQLFLFGTDKLGRDVLSRVIYASRVSLSIGLVGVTLSFVLGLLLGGISGFYGGTPDLVIQRVIEFLISLPQIPIWMALAAALPPYWSPTAIYFSITVILSLIGWTGLARVIRGKFLELRMADFNIAARLAGAPEAAVIGRHMIPSFLSYLVVHLTLAIPTMILAETALSFLGVGLRPPVVSWGVMLKDAQNFRSVVQTPWLLLPGIFVIIAVLAFNFVGDGLRDAADPYR